MVTTERLRRFPFDYYGRYRLAADVVDAVRGSTPAVVLDVGGGPGSLAAFLGGDQVIASDVALSDWHEPAPSLVMADGAALPFADRAFDVVVTLDTLEHVTPAKRPALLREVLRASRGWALAVCPCATEGVAEADSALLAYVRTLFGEEFPTVTTLQEHLVFGLPDVGEVEAALGAQGVEVARFPSGRLDRWLPMMLLFFHLMRLGRDDPVERVQAWYNRLFYADDLRAPSYRQAFLCRLPGAQGPPLAEVVAKLLPDGPSKTIDAAGFAALQTGLGQELVRVADDYRAKAAQLEAELAAARADASREAARAAALEQFRTRVLSHPLVRARSAVRRRLGA
ncbi:MAG: class I SAM-dependent methyltransferase [Egibacteraceae bacterium]